MTKVQSVTGCPNRIPQSSPDDCNVCLWEPLRCFTSSAQKMLLSISVHLLLNSSIVHVNSSHGLLDNVSPHLFPICLHPLLNFILKRVVNVGWFYEGDDPAGLSEGFSITNGTRLVCIPQALETITWN